ncbi:MAG TPA: transglutaminase family protein [Bryobacteraceae bacterium]|nr:transglutaminase family protein [Bryobacteraceae bacterium]
MYYSIRHVTKFRYSTPVSESLMETRMHPRSELNQRCLTFQLSVSPRSRVTSYRDYLANMVYHFDVAGLHSQLIVVAEALVDVREPEPLPYSLGPESWDELDALTRAGDYWEMLMPSQFTQPVPALSDLARELNVYRREDPLRLVRELNAGIYDWFEYVPNSTKVDSPIEEALLSRQGVCQDFAHVLITLVRSLGIPCRYVSGYLHHGSGDRDRSAEGATHAWVEALLPGLGWVGFDPTNNLVASDRHIRTAIGRDYADVPPTRGVFKGSAASKMSVVVMVSPAETLPPLGEDIAVGEDWSTVIQKEPDVQQDQQQQQ